MADSGEKRTTLPADMLYLLTFALGMLAFWLSGHASELLPKMFSVFLRPGLATTAGLAITAAIYGLGMLILAVFATHKSLKGTVLATLIAIILGLVAAQLIVRVAAGHIHSKLDLGLLTFALYLVYGGIYAFALAMGRRVARHRLAAAT
jgi:hypothetical protein